MVKRLKSEGYWVRGVDIKHPEFSRHEADEFVIGDLRDKSFVNRVVEYKGQLGNFFNSIPYKMIEGTFDEVYQFADDMGGAGYIFTQEHDADIMHSSATINLNLLDSLVKTKGMGRKVPKIFYSSSACAYPSDIQEDVNNPGLREEDAYPANPDSDYGWEKLFLKDSTLLTIAIMTLTSGLLVTITSMDLKEPGRVERRRHLRICVERLRPSMVIRERLNAGEMENKLDRSCISMIASKPHVV